MKGRLPAFQEQRLLHIPLKARRIAGLRDFEREEGGKETWNTRIREEERVQI
jgi:hypothetical protein